MSRIDIYTRLISLLFLLKERIYDISKRQYNVFISGTPTENEKILASIFLTTMKFNLPATSFTK